MPLLGLFRAFPDEPFRRIGGPIINVPKANTRLDDVNKACPNPVLTISKNRMLESG